MLLIVYCLEEKHALQIKKYQLEGLPRTDSEGQLLNYLKMISMFKNLLLKKNMGRSMKDMHINANGLNKCLCLD